MTKKLIVLGLILTLILSLSACKKEEVDFTETETVESTTETTTEEASEEATTETTTDETATDETATDETTEEPFVFEQLRTPRSGDVVATMTTNFGDIELLLFPDMAPKAVENFVSHSQEGYYNGLTFHRVMNDFMIQGGDPTGTGAGGESIWGAPFEDEFGPLFPYRGALCMANSGPNTNGSQFFIVQLGTPDESVAQAMTDGGFPTEMVEAYETLGGTQWLFGVHTVFGQVTQGMDVVDTIALTEVVDSKPVEDVIIESIAIKTIE